MRATNDSGRVAVAAPNPAARLALEFARVAFGLPRRTSIPPTRGPSRLDTGPRHRRERSWDSVRRMKVPGWVAVVVPTALPALTLSLVEGPLGDVVHDAVEDHREAALVEKLDQQRDHGAACLDVISEAVRPRERAAPRPATGAVARAAAVSRAYADPTWAAPLTRPPATVADRTHPRQATERPGAVAHPSGGMRFNPHAQLDATRFECRGSRDRAWVSAK